jgi:hypothetical protein
MYLHLILWFFYVTRVNSIKSQMFTKANFAFKSTSKKIKSCHEPIFALWESKTVLSIKHILN